MRGEQPGTRARAQGPGAGGAERAERGWRGRAAGGRGRGRAPPAASPCPSQRGGCIAERRGSAPPWCSSDSCTNPENRVKRKGKAWQRHLPLPAAFGLNSRFLWGGLFQEGVWLRAGWGKASTPVAVWGASSELSRRHWLLWESPGRALAGSEGGWENPSDFSPNRGSPSPSLPLPEFAYRGALPKACSASSIDPTRATVPGSGPNGPVRRGCHLLLCNLAEPARCRPGRDLLALRKVPAGEEQVWRLLTTSTPASVSLCLWVFLSLTLHLSWVYSLNCLILGVENRSLRRFQR